MSELGVDLKKIIFGHETCSMAKVPEVARMLEIEVIFTLWAAVSEKFVHADVQTRHIWA